MLWSRQQAAPAPAGAFPSASSLSTSVEQTIKKLPQGLKSGQVKPAAGEHAIDAALTAGVLQPAEAQTLREAEAARRKVIDVDDFSKEALTHSEGKVR